MNLISNKTSPAPAGTWQVMRIMWWPPSRRKRFLALGWEPFAIFFWYLYLRRVVEAPSVNLSSK